MKALLNVSSQSVALCNLRSEMCLLPVLSAILKGIRNVLAVPCVVAVCAEMYDFDFYLECL